jgi:DNA mismatch repair protein MutL
VQRLALGHPQVAFTLQIGERTVLDLPPDQQLPDRVRQLFGSEMADALLPVAVHTAVCALGGFVAHPSLARPTAKRQFMYLNGRHVKDKLLVAALREGYKGFLEPRLHPAVYLTLDCEPQLVDVNVHPTKAEVRFRRDREIFGLIKRGLQECLSEHVGGFGLLGGREMGSGEGQSATRRSASFDLPGYRNESRNERRNESRGEGGIVARHIVKPAGDPALQERFLPRAPEVTPAARSGQSACGATDAPARDPAAAAAYGSTAEAAAGLQAAAAQREGAPLPPASTAGDRVAEERPRWDDENASDLPGVRRIVQLHDMYLLIETDHGIRLVDQHALHEKAIFLCLDPDRTDVHGAGRQELLTPIVVECGASDLAQLEPLLPRLMEYGIIAEEFGPGSLAVRAFPAILRKTNWPRFFSDLVEGGDAARAVDDLRERIAHRASCRSAVKAGDVLSPAEQRELVRLLFTLEGTEHCPHGRPTTLDLSWGELERRFQR